LQAPAELSFQPAACFSILTDAACRIERSHPIGDRLLPPVYLAKILIKGQVDSQASEARVGS
jgi:hypothetical protein